MRLPRLGRACFLRAACRIGRHCVMLGRKGLTSQAQPPDVVWFETLRNIRAHGPFTRERSGLNSGSRPVSNRLIRSALLCQF
jgi:hypothetical protein